MLKNVRSVVILYVNIVSVLAQKGNKMAEEIKRMDIKDFRELGFLQEVNRQFFHPLGLALEVIVDEETKEEKLGGIWDFSDDSEGMFFINDVIDEKKIAMVKDLKNSKRFSRFMAAREYNFKVDGEGCQVKNK
jgi:hypothetical protein